MTRQINSTGESLTIEQREAAAIEKVIADLTRCRQLLQVFGKMKAVGHVEAAIKEIQ